MSLRLRVLLVALLLGLGPLVVLSFLLRRELDGRITLEHERSIEALDALTRDALASRTAFVRARLAALAAEIPEDNRIRAAFAGRSGARRTLAPFAADAMPLLGLSALLIQDEGGTVLSSGHFPEEQDRIEPGLARAVARRSEGCILVGLRRPEESFAVLAAADSLVLAGRLFHLVGGVQIDRAFLDAIVRGQEAQATFVPAASAGVPFAPLSSDPALAARLARALESGSGPAGTGLALRAVFPEEELFLRAFPVESLVRDPEGDRAGISWFIVSRSRAPLLRARRDLDAWLAAVLAASALGAIILAFWLSARISRPLAELAARTATVDLDNLHVGFEARRRDEVGVLARALASMVARMREGRARLEQAERRATIGEIARQVNHDIRNGLAPIRNAFRHLDQTAAEGPTSLAATWAERRGLLESSLVYLEELAGRYARISRRPAAVACDVAAVAAETVAAFRGRGVIRVQLEAEPSPAVLADPLGVRRILENLIRNALDALEGGPGGRVCVRVRPAEDDGEAGVALEVEDDGPGIAPEELSRVFDDFYTTREAGTGLGLAIVRRLAADFGGSVRAESEPGRGARFTVRFPAANPGGAP